jgi:hypothetical protein
VRGDALRRKIFSVIVLPRGERSRATGASIKMITNEFLAVLLEYIEMVYRENTNDFASIYALDIAITAIKADKEWNEESVEALLENMAALASWILGWEILPAAMRARLEAIRDTHPEFAETATAAAK